MGGHHGGQRWPHGGVCSGADPTSQEETSAGQKWREDQAGNDEALFHPPGHVIQYEKPGTY